MNEIKCPKCGEIFTVDENAYESIVHQIESNEIDKRVSERQKLFEAEKVNAVETVKMQMQMEI